MNNRLKGKVAVITGGTSGIGERSAERFIEEGACVVIGARSEDKGQEIVARLGERAVFCRTDVTVESDIARMIQCAQENFGRLDCLFNNAGSAQLVPSVESLDYEVFDYELKVLLGSVIFGVKHAVPLLKMQGGGTVINNASVAGLWSGYGSLVYSCAKAAVIHATKCLGMELIKQNIRVNAISPGAIETPIFGRAFGFKEELAQSSLAEVGSVLSDFVPMGRVGRTDDIANAAVYLASDDSSFVTGHNLVVDGGMTIGVESEEAQKRWQKVAALGVD